MLFCGSPNFSLKQFFSRNCNDDVVLKFSEEYAGHVYYVHKARVAIRFACELMKIGYGDEVLAPAYNCGTEVDAIMNSGASVTLYRTDKTGQVDIADLQRRISSKTKLIYFFLLLSNKLNKIPLDCGAAKPQYSSFFIILLHVRYISFIMKT